MQTLSLGTKTPIDSITEEVKDPLKGCTFGGDTSVTSTRASLGLRPFSAFQEAFLAEPKL